MRARLVSNQNLVTSTEAGTPNVARYVILRDDDTNALTPPECLERLYRPFLDRSLPVNLATIPAVRTDAKRPNGQPEGFLWNNGSERRVLLANRGSPSRSVCDWRGLPNS